MVKEKVQRRKGELKELLSGPQMVCLMSIDFENILLAVLFYAISFGLCIALCLIALFGNDFLFDCCM